MAGSDRKVLSVKFVAEGIETVGRQMVDLGKAGVDAAARINAAFSKSQIGAAFSQRINAIKQSMASVILAGQKFGNSWNTVGKRLRDFTGSVQGAITRLLKFKAVLGVVGVGATALFKSFGDNAESIQNNAAALGMTTDEYQRFVAAARDVGIEQDKVNTIIAKFNIGVEDAGDKAEEAAKKGDKLSKSLEKIVVTTADGEKKIVTIRRGINKAGEELEKFAGVTKTGTEGLLEYAKTLEAAGTSSQQLQKASKDFGAKNAIVAVKFFRNLQFQFDATARAAAGLVEPLSDVELAIGLDLDTAFDNLTTNLLTTKDRISAVFAPSVTKLITYFTKYIRDNEAAILEWARSISTQAISIFEDFIALLSNPDAKVDNEWLKPLIEGAQEFWTIVKRIFTKDIPDAFTKLRGFADQAATKINEVFGTNFSGDSLLAVAALGYVTGAFDIVIKGALLLIGTLGALATSFTLLTSTIKLLAVAFRPLLTALVYIGTVIAGILGLPAWVGIAIVAALVAAGALIYAYWDEIVAYTAQAWDWILAIASDAIEGITDLFGSIGQDWNAAWKAISTGDWSTFFDDVSQQSKDWWASFIADTKREVMLINDALSYMGVDLPAAWEHIKNGSKGLWADITAGADSMAASLSSTWERIKTASSGLWADVQSTAKGIWDGVAGIISAAATGIAEAVSSVWTAASEAISGATGTVFETASGILDSINQAVSAAGDVQGAIDLAGKLVAPFADARSTIEETWSGLEGVLAAKGGQIAAKVGEVLAPLKTLPDAFSAAASGIPATMDGVASAVLAGFTQLKQSAVAAATEIARGVQTALSTITLNINLDQIVSAFRSAAVSIISAWSSAMSGVSNQTRSMVQAVTSMIASLINYLNALRAAIAAAKAQASSSSSSRAGERATGSYITGPGTGTSDSIPIWASNGEFMLKARAVKHWGLDVLYAMNNLRMPKFAAGGMIGSFSAPSFSRPLDGAQSRLSPYTLVFEGQEYKGFKGPSPDALRQLGKARVINRIASNNRSPKWRG